MKHLNVAILVQHIVIDFHAQSIQNQRSLLQKGVSGPKLSNNSVHLFLYFLQL